MKTFISKVALYAFIPITILAGNVNSELKLPENIDFENFFQNWLSHKYTTWPVISKAEQTYILVSSNSSTVMSIQLEEKLEILQKLEYNCKPVLVHLSGDQWATRNWRSKNLLFHAVTLITLLPSPKETEVVLGKVSQLGWKRKDDFLFISRTTSGLLQNIYGSKFVGSLRHRIGYALDTGVIYVDPYYYAENGLPVPFSSISGYGQEHRYPIMGYSLAGRHIRIAGCVDLPPYHFLRSEKQTGKDIHRRQEHEDGANYQIIISASAKYNFTFETQYEKGSGYGELLQNGTWTGMVGNLIYPERNFDLAIVFGHLFYFYDKFDFVGTIHISTIRFWQAVPIIEEVSWMALFAPFNWDLWGATIIAYIIFSLVTWKVYQNFEVGKHMKPAAQLYHGFLIPYKIAMDQTVPILSDGIRKIAVSWFILTLITGTAYRTVMISFLTFPSYPEVPETWAELALRKDYKIILYSTGSIESLFFKESSNPAILNINSRLVVIEGNDGNECFYGALFHDKTVCIGWSPDMQSRFSKSGIINRNNLRDIPYLINKDAALFTSATIPFQKDSIFTDSFTPIVAALFDTGVHGKWMKDFFFWFKIKGLENTKELMEDKIYGEEYRKGMQRIEESGIGGERPLKIGNVFVVFCILALGLAVALISIIGEVWKHYLNSSSKVKSLYLSRSTWYPSRWNWEHKKCTNTIDLSTSNAVVIKLNDIFGQI